jgi:Na+/H+ antiporter NhaD/arsenite permease-like protein
LLLSGFTNNVEALIVGTDLGGLGTLIASMASLISYKLFAQNNGGKMGRYILYFTVVNVVFLLVLCCLYLF